MNRLPWYIMNDIAYHCSAKCGSQSLLKAFLKNEGLKDPGMGKRRATAHFERSLRCIDTGMLYDLPYTRVQYIREPVERFESLWRWGCRDHNQGIPSTLWEVSPDELLWHIMDNLYDNVHWLPQIIETPYATDVRRLDQMKNDLDLKTKANKTEKKEIPDYDLDLLLALYRPDMDLYDSLKWEAIKNPH